MVMTTILLSRVTPEEGLVIASATVKVSSPSNSVSSRIEISAQCSPVESAVMVMPDITVKSDPVAVPTCM